ncbi:MAG: M2 family metallopeptidase, partial [Calditrichota bacterium]
TYSRYELAKKYGLRNVPEYLPAHWLPNRWGQDWTSVINVERPDLNRALEDYSAEWIVRQSEEFYKSIGFDALPESFYEKSDMYPLPQGSKYKKSSHASAWHMNLDDDIRCLMSVRSTAEYYETVHHEFGHVYYYIAYTHPGIPLLLRKGANRAFHEGVGNLLGFAAMQKPFLVGRGLISEDCKTDELKIMLKEALDFIVFMPWASGVMTEFEYELYSNGLSKDQYNSKWWELKKKHQGIVAPSYRGEKYCDAASKTHINTDAAQYYDYALSYVLLFQLHDHISRKILQTDPWATNYYGNREVGSFLHSILSKGASKDWQKLLMDTLGEDISAKAMLSYFEPLIEYLQEQNIGRKHTL